VTQSQPQRKQRPFDISLWTNKYKSEPKHPDYRGNGKISWETVQELYAAFQSGNYQIDDYSGQPFIQLDVTVWGHPENIGTTKPVLTGGASSLADTMAQAARRAESKVAQAGFGGSPEQIAASAQQTATQVLAQQQAEQQAAFLAHQQQQQQAALLAQQQAAEAEAARQALIAQAVAAPVPTPVAPAPLPAPPAAAPTPIAGTIHGGGALPSPALPPNF
jgi:hypothetical protein